MTSRTTAALAALAVLLACGPASTPLTADKYYGPIDGSALDAKLRPATGARCPTGQSPCYPAQQVSIHGATATLYSMGTVASGLTFTAGTLSGATFVTAATVPYAYDFPDQCLPDPSYDQFSDPYPNDRQYPVFSALPLAPTAATTIVLPIVRVAGLSDVQDNPCNALKKTASIEAGNFGAVRIDPAVSEARLWAVIDPAAWVIPLSDTSAFQPGYGWFKGLLLSYFDGGKVPLNASGNVLTMEGVVVDPAGTGSSVLTANKVIILPFGPDEAAYSPIVRLRHFRAAANTQPSAYTAICTSATPTGGLPPCTGAPNEVNINPLPTPVETLIAVASSL